MTRICARLNACSRSTEGTMSVQISDSTFLSYNAQSCMQGNLTMIFFPLSLSSSWIPSRGSNSDNILATFSTSSFSMECKLLHTGTHTPATRRQGKSGDGRSALSAFISIDYISFPYKLAAFHGKLVAGLTNDSTSSGDVDELSVGSNRTSNNRAALREKEANISPNFLNFKVLTEFTVCRL